MQVRSYFCSFFNFVLLWIAILVITILHKKYMQSLIKAAFAHNSHNRAVSSPRDVIGCRSLTWSMETKKLSQSHLWAADKSVLKVTTGCVDDRLRPRPHVVLLTIKRKHFCCSV